MLFFFFIYLSRLFFFFFFFNDTATTEIYTLSLHDALPICLDQHLDRARIAELAQRLDATLADAHIAVGLRLAEQGLDSPQVPYKSQSLRRHFTDHPMPVLQGLPEI